MKKTAKEIRKKYQQAGVPIYRRNFFSTVVVILASCCDFITIYSVSQELLTERPEITIAITGTVAFILNFLPALLGNILTDKDTQKQNKKVLIPILSVAFVILFILTFLLRWTSRNMLFADTSNLNIFNEAKNDSVVTNSAQNVLTILIGSSTLFTSILSFIFSMMSVGKEEMIRNMKEIRKAELEEKINQYKVQSSELDRIITDNLEAKRDEQAYEDAKRRLEKYRKYFKELARIKLAEYLHNSTATNIVLQREPPIV